MIANLARCCLFATMAFAAGCAATGSHHVRGGGGGPRAAAVTQARSEAARAFDAGVAAYARGDYATAADEFDHANRLRPSSTAQWNLARSAERAGQGDRAARAYLAYLRTDHSASPERQRAAGEALARLR